MQEWPRGKVAECRSQSRLPSQGHESIPTTLSATTAGCVLTKVYSSSFVCHWRKPIDLCRHDEIVLVETLDLLGAQRHSRIAPAEANVGMVT
jgi:hypothetical protein